MAFFNEFPHTRFYDADLGYIIRWIKEVSPNIKSLDDWRSTHEAEYETLKEKVEGIIGNLTEIIVPWDSSIAYRIYSIVEYQGTNYIAIQDVPVGAMITNTDYWTPANTIVEQINVISLGMSAIEKAIPFVTPEDYGAIGDGETDDTGAIQAAIDTGLPVYFVKKKTYRTTGTIYVRTFLQHLVGNGAAILADFDGITLDVNGTTSYAYRTYIHIEGIVLKKAATPNAAYSSNTSVGIHLEHVANATFEDIYIGGHNTGISFDNSLICTFRDCTINNGYRAIYHGNSDLSGMNDCGFYDCKFINQTYVLLHDNTQYIGHEINFYNCQFESNTAPEGEGVIQITSPTTGSTDYANLLNFFGCWIESCKPIFIKHFNPNNYLEQFTFYSCRVVASGVSSFIHSTGSCNATLIGTEDPSVYSNIRFATDTNTWNVLCVASGADGLSRRWGYITRDMRMPKAELMKEATFKVQGSTTTHSIRDNGNYLYFDVTEGREVARGWCFHATYTNPIFSDSSGGNVYLWFANNHLYGKTLSRPASATDGTIII